jgi:hypothetical protein
LTKWRKERKREREREREMMMTIRSKKGRKCMENLMVIRVEVIAPEKPLLSKHPQK